MTVKQSVKYGDTVLVEYCRKVILSDETNQMATGSTMELIRATFFRVISGIRILAALKGFQTVK
ncbi:hypothetical protein D3C81_1501410 [compost metagenome]